MAGRNILHHLNNLADFDEHAKTAPYPRAGPERALSYRRTSVQRQVDPGSSVAQGGG